jgi:zinc protease
MDSNFPIRPLGRILSLSLLLLPALQGASAAAPNKAAPPASVPGFTFVKSQGEIEEYRLDANGLQVLIRPDHSAPVVTFNVVYHVGSRNEVTGTTGSTHLLEHLMFKGSDAYNDAKGNSVKQYLEKVGGSFNATTAVDRTNYFATVASNSLDDYMAIEADRMRNLWLHDADKKAEMTVVRNEYERGKNDPTTFLMEEVTAAAYQALPYHHPTIGWKSDIETVDTENLRAFYDTFYWPNNATAILVGDIDKQAALAMIRKYYGQYSQSSKAIPAVYTEEPEQTGPRRVIVKMPGQLGTVVIAHKVPNGRDVDTTAALALLDSILSDGNNSRFYKALVDTGLSVGAFSFGGGHHDLSLHMLMASLSPGVQHDKVEKAVLAEIERVKKDGVTAEEVASAARRHRVEVAFARDGTSKVAFTLGEFVATGDWALYVTMEDSVARVTPADVQRVARKYFNEDQSTTGWYVPAMPEASGNKTAPQS